MIVAVAQQSSPVLQSNSTAPAAQGAAAAGPSGSWPGGGINPANWYRWMMTGDATSSDEAYLNALDAAGTSILANGDTATAAIDALSIADLTPTADLTKAALEAALGKSEEAKATLAMGMLGPIGDANRLGKAAQGAANAMGKALPDIAAAASKIVPKSAANLLPGSLKREFPREYLGNTLDEIKQMLSSAKGKDKLKLQKAKVTVK